MWCGVYCIVLYCNLQPLTQLLMIPWDAHSSCYTQSQVVQSGEMSDSCMVVLMAGMCPDTPREAGYFPKNKGFKWDND